MGEKIRDGAELVGFQIGWARKNLRQVMQDICDDKPINPELLEAANSALARGEKNE